MIFLRIFCMALLTPAIAVADAAEGGRFSTGSTAFLPCQAARSPPSPPASPRQIVIPLLLLSWSSGLHGREILSSNSTSTTLQLFTYQIHSTELGQAALIGWKVRVSSIFNGFTMLKKGWPLWR